MCPPNGQTLATTETPNGLNQLVQQGAASLTHDAKGNTTAIPGSGSGAGGSTAYQYSQLDHLFGFASGYMMYDGLGRLDYATGPAGTRYLEWSGNRLVSEYVAGVGNRRYVHGPSTGSGGVDEPLLWYEGDTLTDKRYVHADERGSIIAVSNAGGTPFRINSYDEYGNPAATNAGTFGYTGQTWLPELRMWYYKARVMNPKTGRFMQADPIGYQAGMNLYAYVSGDPVNLVDPLGLDEEPCDPEDCILVTGRRTKLNLPAWIDLVGGGGWSLSPSGPTWPADIMGDGPSCGMLCPRTPPPPACPTGPRATISDAFGGTIFILGRGVTVNAEVGIANPTSHWMLGSQAYLSVSVTGLAGYGLFGGGGESFAGGYSTNAIQRGYTTQSVVQGGGAFGPGVEGSYARGNGGSVSGGARVGIGGYAAVGQKHSYTFATSQLGCK